MKSKNSFLLPAAAVILLAVLIPGDLAAKDFSKEIALVKAGKLTEAKAHWWGFNKEDSTKALQAALNSGAKKVYIEKMPSPWITGSLQVPSNIEIHFADGVVVQAQKGVWQEKKGKRYVQKCMFDINAKKNVLLQGHGKVLLTFPVSEQKDHRHTVNIYNSDNVKVKNFEIINGGGDCVYVGSLNCRNVVLEDLNCVKGWRQGLSVTGCHNLTVRNCKFNDTKGTAPECGIDLEPNFPDGVTGLTKILFENCEFNRNNLSGFYVSNNSKQKIELIIRNCEFKDNTNSGFTTGHVGHHQTPNDGTKGYIILSNCRFSGNKYSQLTLTHYLPGVKQIIENCVIDTRGGKTAGLLISNSTKENIKDLVIRNLTVIDDSTSRQPLEFTSRYGNGLVNPVIENITIQNSKGVKRPFDIAKFIAGAKPDPMAQKFNVVLPNFKNVVPVSPKGKMSGGVLRFREKSEFVLYAEPGQTIPVTFINKPVHRYPGPNYRNPLAVTVHSPTINEIDRFGVPFDQTFTYNLKAGEKGVYRFSMDARSQTIMVKTAAPHAFRADEKLYVFGSSGTLYFAVPAGVKDVMVELNGSPREPASGYLCNAEGKIVASGNKLEGGKILAAKRADASKFEIWALQLAVAKSWVRLGAPLLPLFSPDPENILILKEHVGKYGKIKAPVLQFASAVPTKDILRNGNFVLTRDVKPNEAKRYTSKKFPAGFSTTNGSMSTDDKGNNSIHLKGLMWSYLFFPTRGGKFKVTITASGKGQLTAYLSTSISPDGKLRGHKKRLPEEKFTLTEKEQEFTFEFTKQDNELGYLYLRARDAHISFMEIKKL